MHFTRLVSSFAAFCAISMLVVAGCSSDDKATPSGGGGADEGGSAGTAGKTTTTAKVGGSAGTSTTTSSKGGAAGAATTVPVVGGAAGAATTVPTSGGVAGAGTTTVPVTGGAAGATTTTTTTTTAVGGTTGVAGSGSGGTGGVTSTGSTLDDLIGAICGWEFKCCDAGEAKWELGPLVTTAAACKEKFVHLLRTDTAAASPYPSYYTTTTGTGNSPAINGLLINLGYELSMGQVTENPTGIKACIDQWTARGCQVAADPKAAETHCAGTSVGYLDPCDLTNLVKPKLVAGEICNFDLTEKVYNDVECVAGTTCLSTLDADNPNKSYPTCVTRGAAGTTCTFDKDCDFNFYCGSAGKCVEKGNAGATCSFKTPTAPKPDAINAPCKPGLSCEPNTLKCIENCKADYTCIVDSQCPTGQSCMPITVTAANDTTSFKECKAIGSVGTGGVKCDTTADCPAANYCNTANGLCEAQVASGLACSTALEGNCAVGMHCKVGATPPAGVCTAYTGAGQACTRAAAATSIEDKSCDPGTIGCVYKYDTTAAADGYICSSALLANTTRCGADIDCVSGRCEWASPTAGYKTCIAGAAAGELCDTSVDSATDGKTRCGPGLTCDPTSTKCVAQSNPGGACTNAAGKADIALCKNASCNETHWAAVTGGGIMCTDALVPVFDGGTGVVCDGK